MGIVGPSQGICIVIFYTTCEINGLWFGIIHYILLLASHALWNLDFVRGGNWNQTQAFQSNE